LTQTAPPVLLPPASVSWFFVAPMFLFFPYGGNGCPNSPATGRFFLSGVFVLRPFSKFFPFLDLEALFPSRFSGLGCDTRGLEVLFSVRVLPPFRFFFFVWHLFLMSLESPALFPPQRFSHSPFSMETPPAPPGGTFLLFLFFFPRASVSSADNPAGSVDLYN